MHRVQGDPPVEGRPQPGPTQTDNLACLCRSHHRLKTFATGWRFRIEPDGTRALTWPSTTVSVAHAPLSGRNAYGLAACLATSGGFVSAFGVEPSPATIALARHFLRSVMSKDGTTQDRQGADYF